MKEIEYLMPPEPLNGFQCQVCGEFVDHVTEIGGDICQSGTFVCDDCESGYLFSRAGECAEDYIKGHEKEFYLDWWWNEGIEESNKVYYLKRLYELVESEKKSLEINFCLDRDDFSDFERKNLI